MLTQIHGLLKRFQAYLAGLAIFDVFLDFLAGRRIQFLIDEFGEPFEQLYTVLVRIMEIILFHNNVSTLP